MPKIPTKKVPPKTNLTHHFLLASPRIQGEPFERSLVYICRHDSDGALGLIVNKPLPHTSVGKLLDDLAIDTSDNQLFKYPALEGGPMSGEVGFVLHTGQPTWMSSFAITENVCITTSKDILHNLGTAQGVPHFLLCLGHSSWANTQLSHEIEQGDWFVMPASLPLLFDTPYEKRWDEAAAQLGINADFLSMEIGHA